MNPANKLKINIGDRYSFLTVQKELDTRNGQRYFSMLCDCGTLKEVSLCNLRSGCIISCGCAKLKRIKEYSTTHGLSKHGLYNTWVMIRRRCYSDYSIVYHHYGGRGISMCEEWENDFKSFYDWSINNGWQKGLQIDRINNDGDYTPDNCRWVTSKVNNGNKRSNRKIEYRGEIKILSDWARDFNMHSETLGKRLDISKMSIEEALTIPVKTPNKSLIIKSRGKISDKEKNEIKELAKQNFTQKEIANRFNLEQSTISRILNK